MPQLVCRVPLNSPIGVGESLVIDQFELLHGLIGRLWLCLSPLTLHRFLTPSSGSRLANERRDLMHLVADILLPRAPIYECCPSRLSWNETLYQVTGLEWMLFLTEHGSLTHVLTIIECLERRCDEKVKPGLNRIVMGIRLAECQRAKLTAFILLHLHI